MIADVQSMVGMYFSALRKHRVGFETQVEIPPDRVNMMAACAINYGLDFLLVTRYLGGEYTGAERNVEATLAEIGPHIDTSDFDHIKRVLDARMPISFCLSRVSDEKNDATLAGKSKVCSRLS